MRIAVKSDYALRAMLELALNFGHPSLDATQIAKQQKIPKRYLEHLLLLLKKAGLINSFRGKKGGYSLAKRPGEITAREILQAVEKIIEISPKRSKKQGKDIIAEVWQAAQKALFQTFDSITLADLVGQQKQLKKISTYSI